MFMVSTFLYRKSGIYTEGGETTPNFGNGVWPVALTNLGLTPGISVY